MKIRAVFFDMFNTLADPHEHLEHIESEILGMTPAQWNSYVWQKDIARDRGLGIIKTEDELIERICDILPFPLSPEQKKAVMAAHRERLLKCMTEIPADVQAAVRAVKDMGLKLGVISNADVVDISGWPKSPLFPLFDDAVFSCDVGIEKPDRGIYEAAFEHLGVSGEEALFVGDGGSREHMGAKALGMTTVWTEHLWQWHQEKREDISRFADYRIDDFSKIPELVADLLKK
ncbi:MAG: HAD family hydrolase [Firmicutes bacterium]|nr:HAD family hydrolase [Bacillota bacterium]